VRIELPERQRLELGEMYLRRYAILKDIEALRHQFGMLQDQLASVEKEIANAQKEYLREHGIQVKSINPIFENYRLIALEVEEDEPAS